MLVSDFDYRLPEELIAQEPLSDRAAARLLHLSRSDDRLDDLGFRDFPQLLRPDDLLVFNNTKVLPARLFGHRSGSRAQHLSSQNPATKDFLRGRVEVLLTKQLSADPPEWEALVHPGRKLGLGERIYFGAEADESSHELAAEIVGRGTFGERHLRFDPVDDFFGVLNRIGHIPLPPYIDRPDTPSDRESYQTIYAKPLGSVAAPTAGLHFTPEILEQHTSARNRNRRDHAARRPRHVSTCARGDRRGAQTASRVVRNFGRCGATNPARARAAHERGRGNHTCDARLRVENHRRCVRSSLLHRARDPDGRITAQSGEADIFIYPGFEFRVVGAMLTNFHLPKSTLLMLVSAFAGRERTLQAYEHAVRQRYRFYSYGDCMFVE